MFTLPHSMQAMSAYKQFILYKLNYDQTTKKTIKLPLHSYTHLPHDAQDTTNYLTLQVASAFAHELGANYGVAFVLAETDPFFCLDLDNCLLPTQLLKPEYFDLLALFSQCAIEVSQSKLGLHVWGSYLTPPEWHRVRPRGTDLNIEFYHKKRSIVLTGELLQLGEQSTRDIKTPCDDALDELTRRYFSRNPEEEFNDWTTEPDARWGGPEDDDQLLSVALKSKSVRAILNAGAARKASFRDLWTANEDALALAFPPNNPLADSFNRSSADASLAQHLAYWCGNNCERIADLMRKSALNREKWERSDYLPRTIKAACAKQQNFPTAFKSQGGKTCTSSTGYDSLLQAHDVQSRFKDIVYVLEEDRAFIPGHGLITPSQFKHFYGGYQYPIDVGKHSTDAWRAYINSAVFIPQRVSSLCFRPDLEPLAIIELDGVQKLNSWSPPNIVRKRGDVSPFLIFLEKLTPDERDRTILLSYLASLVQNPGVKFQWCIFMQGVQGNGKTLLMHIAAYAVGKKYTHFPRPDKLSGKFNAWLYEKILICIDEIYVPGYKEEIQELLKTIVTSRTQEVEPKGKDQVSREICCNLITASNHRDGLRLLENERRYAPFYTPQQTKADLAKYGLTEAFFDTFLSWLYADGLAICAEYLLTYQINPEFDPAGSARRAPLTTSSVVSVEESLGWLEQEILEAIAQGTEGFRGGFISSLALDNLLNGLQRRILMSRVKRNAMLEGLGYVKHPALPEGRVTRVIRPDNGKPRIYVKLGHEILAARDITRVIAAYTAAQEGSVA